jgi:hypothetical protein
MRGLVALACATAVGCAYPEFAFHPQADTSIPASDDGTRELDTSIDSTVAIDTQVPVVEDTGAKVDPNETAPSSDTTIDAVDTALEATVDTSVFDTPGTNVTLATRGGSWRYLDDGTAPSSSSWRGGSSFDDSKWKTGIAQLGFGDGDEKTVMTRGYTADAGADVGPDAADADTAPPFIQYTSYYFRRSITVTDAASFDQLTFTILRDDGAVVYLNGVEVVRTNMPSGTITNSTYASTSVTGTAESTFYTFVVPAATLKEGTNIIAAEVHQNDSSSSDISFDLELTGHQP